MTIVVYRNGVLAADTLLSAGQTAWAFGKKIRQAKDGALIGACGNIAFVQEFLDWAEQENRCEFEPPKSSSTNQGILITKKQTLYYVGKNPVPIKGPYFVLGSGSDIAMGALWMGATAIEAVHAAIDHNVHCDGQVEWLEL